MKKLNTGLAALIAAALLTACGGGGGGDSTGGGGSEAPAPTPDPTTITVTATTPSNLTASDCPRLVSESDSIAALDLSNGSIRAVNDFLLTVDPVHAYKVFVRAPGDFVNWMAAAGGAANLVTVGAATHETLHMTDSVLRGCATAGAYKVLLHGSIIHTGLKAGMTSNIGIIDAVVDSALKTEPRYTTYVKNAAAGNDFTVLLDELAAYAGAAHTDVQMIAKGKAADVTGTLDANIGGTVNFMVYLQYYLQAARLNYPTTYDNIRNDPLAITAIQAIWSRAEQALRDSYAYTREGAAPRLVVNNTYFDAAYSATLLSELDAIGVTHATRASWSGTYLP